MPVIEKSAYNAPRWLLNGHFDTIYPALFRKVTPTQTAFTHQIETKDGDYFDLHHFDAQQDKTVIISHGLEGNGTRPYVLGMVNKFVKNGWNAISWSYRGCNGKLNKTLRSYHSGFTEDLKEVVHFAKTKKGGDTLALIGFSLGGNLTLMYLAENGAAANVKATVAISTPLDLHGSCREISKPHNALYSRRFLKSLKQKIKSRAGVFPELSLDKLKNIKDLESFDDHYTAPIHGFRDALHYYQSCSSINILGKIQIPTLILNAINDPFLPPSCYPYDLLKANPNVYLETPTRGGHVGFYQSGGRQYWSEKRALEFVSLAI
jgi:predicted alpha/beta-fold hydrolase